MDKLLSLPTPKTPNLPTTWHYDVSVKKTKRFVYKWKTITKDMADELWIARELLRMQGHRTDLTSEETCRSWGGYCKEIGSSQQTVNQWLARWFGNSLVGKMTGNAENYTPVAVIDKVKTVLGGIDLDPASCEIAQEVVKAKTYYTVDDDGLNKPWKGRVFLNPPYGMPLIRDFTDKLVDELPAITAAILLTNDQTDTLWWQKSATNANLICLPQGRLHFTTPDGKETSPTNGQSFFYFGDNARKFRKVFSDMGLIVRVL